MSELQKKLLSNEDNYESVYQNLKYELIQYQSLVDDLQIIEESEVTDITVIKEIAEILKQAQFLQITIKQQIYHLENLSRGSEQRNQIKKLKETQQTQHQRQIKLFNNLKNDCTNNSLKQSLKDLETIFKSTTKEEITNSINIKSNNSVIKDSYSIHQLQHEEPLISQDHQEWQNEIIKENQEQILTLETKTAQINKIMMDIAMEINNQDNHFEIITDNVNQTKQNTEKVQEQLVKTQEQQKSGSKKLFYMLICAIITLFVVLLALFI